LAHIRSNGQIPRGNMSARSSTLSDPHIRSSNTLAQPIRDKTEMRIQGVWNIIWQHLKPQNSHLARARKDATWECQQKQSPTRYLVTYRRQSIAFNLACYRNHSIPSIQGIPYRQTGKDSERATSQVCGTVKGRQEDCSKGSHRLRTAQRNRTKRHSTSSLQHHQGTRRVSVANKTYIFQPVTKVTVRMDHRRTQEEREEETVGDNFLTTQYLAMRLDSHNATLNFTLETLSNHRALISQLQDEVDFLRSQGEKLEKEKGNRVQEVEGQSNSFEGDEGENRAALTLPDLNVPLEQHNEDNPQPTTEQMKE
jgi:hypothetical protein